MPTIYVRFRLHFGRQSLDHGDGIDRAVDARNLCRAVVDGLCTAAKWSHLEADALLIEVPGFRLNMHGKLVPNQGRLDVSARLRWRASKRVKVVNPEQASFPLWRR